MTDLPAPLTPPDCDLTDFPYMELDVQKLRDSKFSATPSGDAFRAGVLLWCAAWHQVPAASLPDDDSELASLAGFGRMAFSLKEWRKVKAEALHGFIRCSDGRLYHTIIAKKAAAAFASKAKYAYGKFLERLRKENKSREKAGKPTFGIPTQEQWNSGAYPHGIPPTLTRIPPEVTATSGQIPAENALKGNREGTEQRGNGEQIPSGTDVPGADGAKAVSELTRAELWSAGKSLLAQAGMPRPQCGSFVGKLVTDYGEQIVVEAVRSAVLTQPADPTEYLKATCMHAAGQRAPKSRHGGFETKNYREGVTADGSLT